MKKCLYCGESLENGNVQISDRNENGMCYARCAHCGYIMRAQVNKTTGKIHQLSKTPETDCEEEMNLAAKLFYAAGYLVGNPSVKDDDIEDITENSPEEEPDANVKSIDELKAKVEEKEAKEFETSASVLPGELLSKLAMLTGLAIDDIIKNGFIKVVKMKKSDLDDLEEHDCSDEDCEDCPSKSDCFDEEEKKLPEFIIYKDVDKEHPRYVFGYDEDEVENILSRVDDTEKVKVFELVEREITKKTVFSLKK